jgi:hypothetical protein
MSFKLSAGFTPDGKLRGSAGELTLLEEGAVLRLDNAELVDNAWSVPTASGCGSILGFLVNPIVGEVAGGSVASSSTRSSGVS